MRKSNLTYKIGRQVAKLRKKQNLTQESFAEKTSISIKTISSLENGKINPSILTLEKVAEKLDVKVSTLISDAEILRTDLNPTMEKIVELLKKENPKIQKLALEQIELLLNAKNN